MNELNKIENQMKPNKMSKDGFLGEKVARFFRFIGDSIAGLRVKVKVHGRFCSSWMAGFGLFQVRDYPW